MLVHKALGPGHEQVAGIRVPKLVKWHRWNGLEVDFSMIVELGLSKIDVLTISVAILTLEVSSSRPD